MYKNIYKSSIKNTSCIIEARMTSSRLPGKVLKKVMGKPLLYYLVKRVKKSNLINKIIIATTKNNEDNVLEKFARQYKLGIFRGSEHDVMGRVIGAAKKYKVKNVVEITSDCPLIDSKLIDMFILNFFTNNVQYLHNAGLRSYPDGMDINIFKLNALEKAYKLTNSKIDREHVTYFFRRNKKIFSQINIVSDENLYWPELGLTIDQKEDYVLIKKIIEFFGKKNIYFECKDIISLLKKKKEWSKINKKVKRIGSLMTG
mgnify:CR=1 FL=1|tara:strand:+ start:276 stop:1049 length:774 start_codon:yes stop_codon:yes gene_type:complete